MFMGGWSAVASALSKRYEKNISRQQVHTWWTRRDHNGFPEGSFVCLPGRGTKTRLFVFEEVADWYASYIPDKGGRPTAR